MNLMRSTGMLVAAFALVALGASEAAAQAPQLSVTAVGARVTIEWSNLQPLGAQGYNLHVGTTPGGSQIGEVNLPTSVTRVVVDAPDGTYYLRVRGLAGALAGPFSNEASVTVGGPCVPPSAPSVTAAGVGGAVEVNWSAVAGVAGYRIEFGLTPDRTDLVQTVGPSTTKLTKWAGILGTFYVRVTTGNACGMATSPTVGFTIENLNSGAGPRAPDPPPGQLLPIPSYAEAVVFETARLYPAQLRRACKNNHEWLFLLVRELRKYDSRWGLNWKRGNAGDMSTDIVAYNPTHLPDEGNGQVYLFDVIFAECEVNAPSFGNATHETWAAVGNPACAPGTYCTKWTLQPYINAGFIPDGRNEQ